MTGMSRVAPAAVALAVGITVGASPPRPQIADAAVERLYGLAELYGAVRYFHPGLVHDGTGWDAAVAAAVVPAQTASSRQTYALAVDAALRTLDDPASRVLDGSGTAPGLGISSRSNGVLVVGFSAVPASASASERLAGEIAAATRVVFELRSDDILDADAVNTAFAAAAIDRRLAPVAVQAPAQRTRSYSGFPPESGQTSGGYQTGWHDVASEEWKPLPGVVDKRVVFVIGDGVPVPAVALALQRSGRAALLVEGTPNDAAAVLRHRLQLPHDVHVAVRTGDLVGGVRADSTLAPARDAAARSAARAVAAQWLDRVGAPRAAESPSQPPASPSPVLLTAVPDAALAYPDAGWRAVAAFRVWNTFRYFFPYRHLMEADWDATLKQYLPRVLDARDSLQYGLAMAEMLTHTVDSHVNAGSTLRDHFGTAVPPVRVRIIEGAPVITDMADDSVAQAAGVAVGDVIVAIDGEPAAERSARIARYTTESTAQRLNDTVAYWLLAGAEGEALLTVRDAAGRDRQVRLPRRATYRVREERTGDIVRILPGNIGYVDLDRLPRDSVAAMFEQLRGTRGIIFDMRGYPQGTAWLIAPRLTDRTNVTAASFRRNVVNSPDVREITSYSFDQVLPPAAGFRYAGPTAMLIDERAMSQSEHTGLFLKAANNTVFVGSPTAGANGDITTFILPGRINVTFSGHDVRWPDGRQLQRVGLIPDVPVQPTIAGIRAGRDEVLERAVEVINDLVAE